MMVRRGQQRRRDERAAHAKARAEAELEAYRPPARAGLTERFYSYVATGSLWIDIYQWRDGRQLVDFYARVYISTPDGEETVLASVDCRNHGTVHLHDEPDHTEPITIHELESVYDVQKYFHAAIDYLIDYSERKEGNHE